LEKFTWTIGVFAGVLREDGKLLLRKRVLPEERESITGKEVKGDWELPGGAVKKAEAFAIGHEGVFIEALKREIKEELGLEINLPKMAPMYPAALVKRFPDREIADSAFLMVIQPDQWRGEPKGIIKWVNPDELKELAERKPGDQLLSGWGKRMCRMALKALTHSPNKEFAKKADEYLTEIQSKMWQY
jgi:8-oxo-dGTP pyrophosphatase MutT (NUDIX family)